MIAGMGAALEMIRKNQPAILRNYRERNAQLRTLLREMTEVAVNSPENGCPHVLNISVPGIPSEIMLHALEEKGIYVSSGSACSSHHPGGSGALKGIGVKKELLDSTLRFSFGLFNTPEEVDYAVETLKELLPMLRRYRAR